MLPRPGGACGAHRELVRAERAATSGNSGVIVQAPFKGHLSCEWIVRAPATAASAASSDVSVLFEKLHLEAGSDVVTVYECAEASCASAEKLASFSRLQSSFSLTSGKGHGLKITLESEGQTPRKGFLATYCPAASAPCNALLQAEDDLKAADGRRRDRALTTSGSVRADGHPRPGHAVRQGAGALARRQSKLARRQSKEASNTRTQVAQSAVSGGSWTTSTPRQHNSNGASRLARTGVTLMDHGSRRVRRIGNREAGLQDRSNGAQTAHDAYRALVKRKLSRPKHQAAERAQEQARERRERAREGQAARRDDGQTQDGAPTTQRLPAQESPETETPAHEQPPRSRGPSTLRDHDGLGYGYGDEYGYSDGGYYGGYGGSYYGGYGGGGYADGGGGGFTYSNPYRTKGKCTDFEGFTDDMYQGCDYYDEYWESCAYSDWMSSPPNEACCACGGGDTCQTSIGGVDGKCGCSGQCTNSIDLTSGARSAVITSSLDDTQAESPDGYFDPIYSWSECFWVVKTHGNLGSLDVNITGIPDGHFLEISSCDGKKCCSPLLMGQTEEGKLQRLRVTNPPSFVRLDLKTYSDDVPDGQSLTVRITSYRAGDPPATVCGDGVPGDGEQCDDQNTADGDGCSSACAIEDDWACSGGIREEVALSEPAQVMQVTAGPMACKKICRTDNPCADCEDFDSGYGTCADYAKDGTLHDFCKEDFDEFNIYAVDACPVACATSFILLCNSNANASIAFDTLETATEIPAAVTEIEPNAFPDGSALRAVRHKFPSSTDRSERGYTLQSLADVWKDAVKAGEMGAPPLPSDAKRNAGIRDAVLNHDIVGNTALRVNDLRQAAGPPPGKQLTARVTMAVDPCRLRTAGGCRNVLGKTLELCGPGQAALFSYVDEAWSYDGSSSAHVDPEHLTNMTGVTGKFNASSYISDQARKALDAAGFSPFARPRPPPAPPGISSTLVSCLVSPCDRD